MIDYNDKNWQDIGGMFLLVDEQNRFSTDAVLLESFACAKRKETVLDIGTGCGIIPFLIKRKNAGKKIFAVDIQKKAIDLLSQSIERNNVKDIIPLCVDAKDIKKMIFQIGDESLDLVVSNPPYYAEKSGGEYVNDDRAICREENSISIYDIAKTANALLKYGGRLCVCYKPQRLCDLIDAMRQNKIEPKKIRFVHKNENSEPWLVLVEGKKGAKPFVKVLPSLFVNSQSGQKEMHTIYNIEEK